MSILFDVESLQKAFYVELLPRDLELPALFSCDIHDFVENLRSLFLRYRGSIVPAGYASRVDHEVGIVFKEPLASDLQRPVIHSRYHEASVYPPAFPVQLTSCVPPPKLFNHAFPPTPPPS